MKDPKLADDLRGFIGQEATHADTHEEVLHEYMVVNGIDPQPIVDEVSYVFEKLLAPTTAPTRSSGSTTSATGSG